MGQALVTKKVEGKKLKFDLHQYLELVKAILLLYLKKISFQLNQKKYQFYRYMNARKMYYLKLKLKNSIHMET